MMSSYTQQEIEDRFARLPEPLKEQMMSVENSERIFEAGKKFGLTIEQIGFLAEESGYVVLGLTHPKDFVARLKDHLRVDEEQAKIIAKEINHHVFFPLREILKTTHQFELIQEEIQTPPPPIPLPPRTQPLVQKPSPIIQNQTRSVDRPALQNEVKPSARQAVPIVVFPTPPTSAVSPVSSTPPAPSLNKPIVSPPTPPISDIKSPILPAPIKPSAPQAVTIPPILNASPQKLPVPPVSSTQSLIPQNVSHGAVQDKQGLIVNLKITAPTPSQAPQTPLAPSQMMQKKIFEETKTVKIPSQPPVERMKESLFALPSAPLQQKPAPPNASPPSEKPTPPSPTPIKNPSSSYAARDPYREPID